MVYLTYIELCCRCSNFPIALAIDCEMCETADPLTGAKDPSALVRISIVDALNPGEAILDTLVNPFMPISASRSFIHGIDPSALAGVTFTLRHAQAALHRICSDRTILLGHSLHNDLKAMRFKHTNVVDTAYLYAVQNEPGSTPGLRDIAASVLNMQMLDTHDSVQDARAAAMAALYIVENGYQPPIARANGGGSSSSSSSSCGPSLLAHRVPYTCTESDLIDMLTTLSAVVPSEVKCLLRGVKKDGKEKDDPVGKFSVIFKSQAHADLAFETLPGPNRPDKSNRPQKRVYLRNGGYLCIRKNQI